ncbi:MAG TPA: hypothetical protein ENN35_00075 [Deltaproteobacteria bacterium]|nr:hypothetical protein [Deltaproteobacteria bacterium]
MKIAIAADGRTLDAQVSYRIGSSRYLLIVDSTNDEFDVVSVATDAHSRGAAAGVVVTAIGRGVDAVAAGYCSPGIVSQLENNGIEVLTGIKGTAKEALGIYRSGRTDSEQPASRNSPSSFSVDRDMLKHAIARSARQFTALLPVLLGVVMIVGLFDSFVSREMLLSVFRGNAIADSLFGACLGSLFAGNPINSYVIGGELLKYGISLFAVTTFIVSWVTVGVIQLSAEMAALGRKFALLRNAAGFLMVVPVAMLTVVIVDIVTRWLA